MACKKMSVFDGKSLENGAETVLQVLDNVVYVFRAYRKPHRGGRDASRLQFFLRHLGMGGGSRVDHQGLDVRHVGEQGE